MSDDGLELPEVELLGALTYGQLRSFEITTSAIRVAPGARIADRLAQFAQRESEAYMSLRDHLIANTDLGAAVIDRQKPVFDAYFDAIPMTTWWEAVTFFAVGLPMASDFVRELAPTLQPSTAEVIVRALAMRDDFEAFALGHLQEIMAEDADRMDEIKSLVADVVGRALTGFQGAIADTDALQQLLTAGGGLEDEDALVRRMAITVLEGHRRRMHKLGIEDLD